MSHRALWAEVAESERTAATIHRCWRALAEVEVTEQSPDGYVAVTAGADGLPRRLELDPRIYRDPDAGALAATILETLAEAGRLARIRGCAAIAPLLPADAVPEETDLAFDPLLTELDRRRRP